MRWMLAVLLVAGLAGCLADETNDADADPERPVTPKGWSMPVLLQNSTGREMSLAIDPNDDERMLACSPTGTGVVGQGENTSDFWLSLDGGRSWILLHVEAGGEAPDLRDLTNEGGDCDVEVGPDGTLWTVDSWLGSLAVSWSSDGENWDGTALGAMIPVADRPWIRADASGRLHMTYQDVQFGMPSAIWYTSTTDGESWSVPTSVTTATQDGLFTWTGDFVVTEDGQHLWSIYTRRAGPTASDLEASGPEQVWIAHSGNSGTTWSSSMLSQRLGPSSFLYASLDMDTDGGLHATWSEFLVTEQPAYYAYQPAGGSWTEPLALTSGQRTGAPWIAAGENGTAVVLWSGSSDPAGQGQAWWFYVADVQAGKLVAVETTTPEPIWVGNQASFPEFNEIMLDNEGQAHIAAVAPCQHQNDGPVLWCPYYQART